MFLYLSLVIWVLYCDYFFTYIRLEEKLSNLESENQVLRQQALTMSPTGKTVSARPRTTIIQVKCWYVWFYYHLYSLFLVRHSYSLVILQRPQENGNILNGETKPGYVRLSSLLFWLFRNGALMWLYGLDIFNMYYLLLIIGYCHCCCISKGTWIRRKTTEISQWKAASKCWYIIDAYIKIKTMMDMQYLLYTSLHNPQSILSAICAFNIHFCLVFHRKTRTYW